MIKILSASQIEVDRLENWPGDWPDKENRVSQHDVTREQLVAFTSLLKTRPAELEIERFLSANKEVLSMTVWLFSTGHHMSWVFSKPEIKGSINGSGA